MGSYKSMKEYYQLEVVKLFKNALAASLLPWTILTVCLREYLRVLGHSWQDFSSAVWSRIDWRRFWNQRSQRGDQYPAQSPERKKVACFGHQDMSAVCPDMSTI